MTRFTKKITTILIVVPLVVLSACSTNVPKTQNLTLLKGAKLQSFSAANQQTIINSISSISLNLLKLIDRGCSVSNPNGCSSNTDLSHASSGCSSVNNDNNNLISGYSLIYTLGMLWVADRDYGPWDAALRILLARSLNSIQYAQLLNQVNKQTLSDLGQGNSFINDNSYWLFNGYAHTRDAARFYALTPLYNAPKFIWNNLNQLANGINLHVEKATGGFLNPKLSPSNFPKDNLYAALLNVIYFHAYWSEILSTVPDTFCNSDGVANNVTFLTNMSGNYHYLKTPYYLALSLPYNNSKIEMDLIMPTNESIPCFVGMLNPGSLETLLTELDNSNTIATNIYFPQFEVRANNELWNKLQVLYPYLVQLGNDVYGIQQVTKIDVNQYGTTAAAATIEKSYIVEAIQPELDVKINHPFLFIIRDPSTNAIFFIGQIVSLS